MSACENPARTTGPRLGPEVADESRARLRTHFLTARGPIGLTKKISRERASRGLQNAYFGVFARAKRSDLSGVEVNCGYLTSDRVVVEWGFLSFGVKPEIFIVEGAQTTPDPGTAGASGHMTTRARARQRSSPSSSPPLLLHHILPSPPHISYFLLSASSSQRPTLRRSQRQRTTSVAGPPQPPQAPMETVRRTADTDRGYSYTSAAAASPRACHPMLTLSTPP